MWLRLVEYFISLLPLLMHGACPSLELTTAMMDFSTMAAVVQIDVACIPYLEMYLFYVVLAVLLISLCSALRCPILNKASPVTDQP